MGQTLRITGTRSIQTLPLMRKINPGWPSAVFGEVSNFAGWIPRPASFLLKILISTLWRVGRRPGQLKLHSSFGEMAITIYLFRSTSVVVEKTVPTTFVLVVLAASSAHIWIAAVNR